ncbi:hypothetical protein GGD56_006761 [Rhizobium mongolense]|uniref:Uncharacterized protein n=1 Tax=Rhizobium mongolense TaxID=57676 RepID=A0ABR6IY93_9HYPH|nr:hypothetical protein [Rhizobium mongolense]
MARDDEAVRRLSTIPGIARGSKRGNRYRRTNLVQGARAVLPHILTQETPLGPSPGRALKNIVVRRAGRQARAHRLGRSQEWAQFRSVGGGSIETEQSPVLSR